MIFFSAVDTVLSCSECLTVCVVPRQILMSARCPLHALREYAQTQRAPSHASNVNLVTKSLRMDSGVMVRLLAVSVQDCAFVCLYAWAQARVCVCVCVRVYVHVCSFHLCSKMQDLALIANTVAAEGEGWCASWIRLYVNSIRCDSFDPKAPSSELKIPKYSFQTSHHSWIVDPSASGTTHLILAQDKETSA